MKLKFIALLVAIIASTANAGKTNIINNIETKNAPKPLGAYSQATSVDLSKGKLLFISGQVAQDPQTGLFLENDIQTATNRTLDNIEKILKAAGSDWKYVVKMEVFLKDMNDWDGMNAEYAKRFPDQRYPARHTVQVGIENRIEISCTAIIPHNKK